MVTDKRNRTKRIFRWVVVPIVICIGYAIYAEWRGLSHMHYIGYDYAFFYYAFQAVLHHHVSWTSLYNMHAQQILLKQYNFPIQPYNQYVYPPQFAWLFSLFGLLPFYLSVALWMLTSVVLYFFGLFWLVKLLWPRIRRIHLLALFLLAAVMDPFQVDIGAGNVNSILFAAISLTFYLLYHRNKAGLAGIPLGLAILLKVTPAAILVFLLFRGQWRVCRSTAVVIFSVTALSALFVGVSPIVQYALHFSSFGHTSMKNGSAPYNQSIIGVMGMFHQHHWLNVSSSIQHVVYMLFVGCALWAMYSAIRKHSSHDWRLDIAMASLTPIVFSPLVEETHMVFVLPTLMVFARLAQEAYAQRTKTGLYTAGFLGIVTSVSILFLSLPTTFALNFAVSHWPQWFWIHTQMFDVLIAAFITTLWLYRHPVIPLASTHQKPHLVRCMSTQHNLSS